MKQYDERSAIEYADGVFRAVRYAYFQVYKYADTIERINDRLYGSVHSQAIISSEMAKYKRSRQPYKDRIPELITERDEAERHCRQWAALLSEIGRFLMLECTDAEIRILGMYYEQDLPLWKIGELENYSKEAIRKIINRILKRYAKHKDR